MTLVGCVNDPLDVDGRHLPGDVPADDDARDANVYVRLSLQLPDDSPSSRAGEPNSHVPDYVPGTLGEYTIRSLDLLVCDAATEKILDIFSLNQGDPALADIINGQAVVPLYARADRPLHLRVAVNAPARMREQMLFDASCSAISMKAGGDDYRSVINAYLPGSNGLQETLNEVEHGYIPMTGIFTEKGKESTEIVIPAEAHTTPETALEIHADLERIVAKMHVVSKAIKHSTKDLYYVIARDPNLAEHDAATADGQGSAQSSPSWLGWIRTTNVLYIPNGVNKSTYLFPQANESPAEVKLSALRDPNMNLDAYGFSGQIAGSDDASWADDYVYYNGVDLQNEVVSPDCVMSPIEIWSQDRINLTYNTGSSGSKAAAPAPIVKPYVRGMYCTENYFDKPWRHEDFAKSKDAIPMVTHLSVAAKLTPRWIVVKKDFKQLVDDYFIHAGSGSGSMTPEDFREQYGIEKSDVTQEERDLWEKEISAHTAEGELYNCLVNDAYVYLTDYRILTTANEEHAAAILDWSLKGNGIFTKEAADFENGLYPSGTFYSFKYGDAGGTVQKSDIWKQDYLYLSAGAVASAKGANNALKIYSVPHIGGWGYYYTYIRGTSSTPAANPMPYTASQVTRNTYYLLTVENFGSPGGSVNHPEYIKVNTDAIGWDYVGRGDIELK